MGENDMTSKIIGVVITLIFIAAILPYGLVNIANIGAIEVPFNGTTTTLDAIAGMTTTVTLMSTLIPLAIAIAIILYFVKFAKNN